MTNADLIKKNEQKKEQNFIQVGPTLPLFVSLTYTNNLILEYIINLAALIGSNIWNYQTSRLTRKSLSCQDFEWLMARIDLLTYWL